MSKVCPTCKQVIKSRRTTDISTHFHAHITQITRDTGMERAEVYIRALLLACEIEVDWGSPYPYVIVDDVLHPKRTTERTNKEMITAIGATHQFAAECEVTLREKSDD